MNSDERYACQDRGASFSPDLIVFRHRVMTHQKLQIRMKYSLSIHNWQG